MKSTTTMLARNVSAASAAIPKTIICAGSRVVDLCRKRRGVAKTRRRSARLGRLGFYRFQFRQRLRAANIGFEPGFDRAESDSVLETQRSVGYRDAVYFGAVGRFEIFEAISFANEF